jgi:hypothetical protein
MHPAALDPAALLATCRETRTKRSGPGGQHRNKTETAVVLTHLPTGITAEASERRSQAENRRMALWRLRLRLALEYRLPPDPGSPSTRWKMRSQGGRLAVRGEHDDYPPLVAEALDRLATTQGDAAAAASQLGVTATQFVRLFKKQPSAWMALAACRRAHGLPPLR